MKSPFVLPALCAAAIHAALLVSFENPPSNDSIDPTDPDPLPVSKPFTLVLPPPPPPDEIVDAATAPKSDAKPIDARDFTPRPANPAPPRPDPGAPKPVKPELISVGNPNFTQDPHGYVNSKEWGDGISDHYDSIFSPGSLDRIPETRLRISPRYPESMRQIGREAEVLVTFVVNREGKVIEAQAEEAAPTEFAREAERALLRWRFEPGTRDGQPVSFRMCVPLVFALGER